MCPLLWHTRLSHRAPHCRSVCACARSGGRVGDVLAAAAVPGILTASLRSDGTDVADVNMVVQVAREGGELVRTIYNPLE